MLRHLHNSKFKKDFKNSQAGGFIEFFLAIIIAIVMLRLLGIDLSEFLGKPEVRSIAIWMKDIALLIGHDLLKVFQFVRDIFQSN